MYFKDIGYLLTKTTTYDTKNRPKVSYTENLFYCNRKSVRQSEFYQSDAAGFKPEIMLEARLIDISNIDHIKFDNKIYKILRSYKKEDLIELILTSTVIENK